MNYYKKIGAYLVLLMVAFVLVGCSDSSKEPKVVESEYLFKGVEYNPSEKTLEQQMNYILTGNTLNRVSIVTEERTLVFFEDALVYKQSSDDVSKVVVKTTTTDSGSESSEVTVLMSKEDIKIVSKEYADIMERNLTIVEADEEV